MSEPTLRTGDLVTVIATVRISYVNPDGTLVLRTHEGDVFPLRAQPGVTVDLLTSGATLTAPAQDSGIEPAAALAPPAVLPSSGRGTTLLDDIGDLQAGWAGHVEPRPITDPALRPDGGEQHG